MSLHRLIDFLTTPRGMAAGGAGVFAVIMAALMLFGFSTSMLLPLALGALGISLTVFFVLLYLRWRLQRFYSAGDQSLMRSMRGRPAGVSDPEQLATLDQFSKKFEEGCRLFVESTGLAVSESPWYMLVGESGSGKTEAIRHCGVEFPDDLHKERQGAGGTTNMDWWFTEQAIILDTAGRFAIDPNKQLAPRPRAEDDNEAENESDEDERERRAREATKNEWGQFLKEVVKVRPHCPINGLILVIPATSLIKDDLEKINRKGEELARFLTGIRLGLGVRFPVFILVTKSDLIPGFREYFNDFTAPEYAQQMFGWSKPGSLDEQFDPSEIDDYFEEVREKLERRRLTLIQDPVHSQLPGKRRIEQVDALYTFPRRFAELAPQLRRYLGRIFVRSKFNQAPLFLRGVYFTSAMESGAALDTVLAKLRGVTLKQLERQGAGLRRNRPMFLRDLFKRKVFPESGLVTRETQTQHIRKRRQVKAMSFGIGAAVLGLVLTMLGYYSFVGSLGAITDQWVRMHSARNEDRSAWDVLAASSKKWQAAALNWKDTQGTQIRDFLRQQSDAGYKVRPPWVFRLIGSLDGLETDRKAATEKLVGTHLANCILNISKVRVEGLNNEIKKDSGPLKPEFFAKGGPLLVAAERLKEFSAGKSDPAIPPLGALLDLCVTPVADEASFAPGSTEEKTARDARDILATLSRNSRSLNDFQPTASLRAREAAKLVCGYWADRLGPAADERQSVEIRKLRVALNDWDTQFKLLTAIASKPIISLDESTRAITDAQACLQRMQKSAKSADDALVAIASDPRFASNDINKIYETLSNRLLAEHKIAVEALGFVETLQLEGVTIPKTALESDRFTFNTLTEGKSANTFYLAQTVRAEGIDPAPLYRVLTEQTRRDFARLDSTEEREIQDVAQLAAISARGEELRSIAATIVSTHSVGNSLAAIKERAQDLGEVNAALIAPRERHFIVRDWLNRAPRNSIAARKRVKELCGSDAVAVLPLPLTRDDASMLSLSSEFDKTGTSALLAQWQAVRDVLDESPSTKPASSKAVVILEQSRLLESSRSAGQAVGQFLTDYLKYWADLAPKPLKWNDWHGLAKDLTQVEPDALASALDSRYEICLRSTQVVVERVPTNSLAIEQHKQLLLAREAAKAAKRNFGEWLALAKQPAATASKLTSKSAKELFNTYLKDLAATTDGCFHRELVLHAVELIATESRDFQGSEFNKINSEFLQKFPFNRNEPKFLNELQLKKAQEALENLLGPAELHGTVATQGHLADAFGEDPRMLEAVAKLFDSVSVENRAKSALAFVKLLRSRELAVELTLVDADDALYVAIDDRKSPPATFKLADAFKQSPFVYTKINSGPYFFIASHATEEKGVKREYASSALDRDAPQGTWALLRRLAGAGQHWQPDGKGILTVTVAGERDYRRTLTFTVKFTRNGQAIPFSFPFSE